MINTNLGKYSVYLCLNLLLWTNFSNAQTVHGKVIDQRTKQPIPAVYISINQKPITATDENGIFSIENIQRIDTISFSHLIYEHKDLLVLGLKRDTTIVKLKLNCFNLNEVEVVENKVKHIIHKAHKAFVKQYQPINCWTKANYKHLILKNGKAVNFLESHGYAMLIKPVRGAFGSEPLFIEVNTRRTQWHETDLFYHKRKATKSVPFDVFWINAQDFCFCQSIMPVGKFHFKDYRFKLDSLSDLNDNQYVIDFVQRSKRMVVSGWCLWGASGKIWLNRKTFLPERIAFVYKFRNDVLEYDISFLRQNNMIFPEKVRLITTHHFLKKKHQINNYLSISQFNVFDIDTVARINYRIKKMDSMIYLPSLLSPDIKYNSEYWSGFPLEKTEWYSDVKSLCNGDLESEFKKGDVEPVLNKNCKYYQGYIEGSELKEKSKNFVNQMKKDLEIEKDFW